MDHKKELLLIKDLMDKLVEEMEPTTDDFDERLGRQKPVVESIEVGVIPEEDIDDEDFEDDELGLDGEMEEEMMLPESEEDDLLKRIQKLKG